MAGAIAAFAVRGNSIYLHYATDSNPFGSLSVISPQPPSSASSSSAFSPTSSPVSNSGFPSFSVNVNKGGLDGQDEEHATVAPTAPITNTALYIQPQTVRFNSTNNPFRQPQGLSAASLSMVSTSSFDPQRNHYRHDLLLAYNLKTPQSRPILVRLTPQFPATGSGLQPSASGPFWMLDQPSLQLPSNATKLWLASGVAKGAGGITTPAPEGSSVYQLIQAGSDSVPQLVKTNVTNPLSPTEQWRVGIFSTRSGIDGSPKVIRLSGSSFDAAVIGSDASSMASVFGGTRIQMGIEQDFTKTGYTMPDPYDPSACYTEANGQIIMASSQTILTFTYPPIGGIPQWGLRQPPSLQPYLKSPILACATVDSTLYAVIQGDGGAPAIYTVDMGVSGKDWFWTLRNLVNVPNAGNADMDGDDGSNNGGGNIPADLNPNSSSRSNGISTGTTIGIVVAVVILLGAALLWFLWRRRRIGKSKYQATGSIAHVEKMTIRPPPTRPPPPPGGSGLGYSPGPGYMTPQGVPVVVSMSPQMNHHQPTALPPTTSAAGWTAAVYPASQPGEYIPMVASSLSTASLPPPPPPFSYTSEPSTPAFSQAYAQSPIMGDKQELTSEDTSILLQPASSAVGYQKPAQRGSMASTMDTYGNSYGGDSSSSVNNTVAGGGGGGRNDRMKEMFSPGLANAQLILQRSQSPPNQPYPEQQHQHQHQYLGQHVYHR
ncbi:hypothetical protein BGX23_006971 [Mortierella sp. AD031]|nr:hypothetical protein BGX23_006971 [Mortierella sp. AD031]